MLTNFARSKVHQNIKGRSNEVHKKKFRSMDLYAQMLLIANPLGTFVGPYFISLAIKFQVLIIKKMKIAKLCIAITPTTLAMIYAPWIK